MSELSELISGSIEAALVAAHFTKAIVKGTAVRGDNFVLTIKESVRTQVEGWRKEICGAATGEITPRQVTAWWSRFSKEIDRLFGGSV